MGRPRKGDQARVLKTFRLDPSTVKKIDQLRKETKKSGGKLIDDKFKD